MASIRFLEFLLLLLPHRVLSEEVEPVFKAKYTAIEMGYCFGMDYIVVYRCAPEGDLLLGNSSFENPSVTLPEDLQGRIHINKVQHLLGFQISNLTHKDSGIYRRECWQHQTLVSQIIQQLSVCDKEVESEEIVLKEEDEGAELLCNNTSIGLEGTSVRWYYETFPLYKVILLMDSSVSLEILVKEFHGVVKVQHNGASLLFDKSTLKTHKNFYCLVSKGKTCLSFQNMHLQDNSESTDIFATQGERVVLKCPAEGTNQQWETPLGMFNASSMKMNLSLDEKSKDFSLVIPAFSEDLSGEYSCFSSLFEVRYYLVLCSKKDPKNKVVVEGGSVLLDCDVGKEDSQSVQWYRREPSGKNRLIHDSYHKTAPIPGDLMGRLSENVTTLTISHLEVQDEGVYWCVVLEGPVFLEYPYDGGEEDTEEDEYSEDPYWDDTQKCVSKQETVLTVIRKNGRIWESENVTLKPVTGDPKEDQPETSNVTANAVGGGLVGMLVIGVIVGVIYFVKKRKAKVSSVI
ncbi:hypothetical protein PBY51_012178 [Eleginops maclovinus]|uniref:Ig-like domain-containing protein n=1 Tax=Eleginops maclovinus TaxID=56733 RepID=A0AAN8AUJ3_ELEMC|nr:hypothetical protein PBY51_012178 [Eleginops maclovinus]